MNEKNNQSEYKSKKGNFKTVLLIVLIIIITLVSSVKIFLDHEEKQDMQVEISQTYNRLDSISMQLDSRITEIEKLGGDVAELEIMRKGLERDKENLLRDAKKRNSQLNDYKDKVEGYEELLKLQDEKIVQLEAVNKQLLAENTGLKHDKNELSESITNLRKKERELESKVATAARLKAENIQINAVNKRGREKEGEFKSKQIETLRIDFNLAENNVAPVSGKDIIMRIIDPYGNVLFDVARGSGTFMIAGKELFYTAKQEILFDNTKQQLSFNYDKMSDYEPGIYSVEIYADDYIIGLDEFTVK